MNSSRNENYDVNDGIVDNDDEDDDGGDNIYAVGDASFDRYLPDIEERIDSEELLVGAKDKSQNELIKIQESVKKGEMTLMQANVLFQAWQINQEYLNKSNNNNKSTTAINSKQDFKSSKEDLLSSFRSNSNNSNSNNKHVNNNNLNNSSSNINLAASTTSLISSSSNKTLTRGGVKQKLLYLFHPTKKLPHGAALLSNASSKGEKVTGETTSSLGQSLLNEEASMKVPSVPPRPTAAATDSYPSPRPQKRASIPTPPPPSSCRRVSDAARGNSDGISMMITKDEYSFFTDDASNGIDPSNNSIDPSNNNIDGGYRTNTNVAVVDKKKNNNNKKANPTMNNKMADTKSRTRDYDFATQHPISNKQQNAAEFSYNAQSPFENSNAIAPHHHHRPNPNLSYPDNTFRSKTTVTNPFLKMATNASEPVECRQDAAALESAAGSSSKNAYWSEEEKGGSHGKPVARFTPEQQSTTEHQHHLFYQAMTGSGRGDGGGHYTTDKRGIKYERPIVLSPEPLPTRLTLKHLKQKSIPARLHPGNDGGGNYPPRKCSLPAIPSLNVPGDCGIKHPTKQHPLPPPPKVVVIAPPAASSGNKSGVGGRGRRIEEGNRGIGERTHGLSGSPVGLAGSSSVVGGESGSNNSLNINSGNFNRWLADVASPVPVGRTDFDLADVGMEEEDRMVSYGYVSMTASAVAHAAASPSAIRSGNKKR